MKRDYFISVAMAVYNGEKYIKEQVEEMYSLYDAIFKSSEGDYYKEEEVRFIIAIRSSEDHSLLEQL